MFIYIRPRQVLLLVFCYAYNSITNIWWDFSGECVLIVCSQTRERIRIYNIQFTMNVMYAYICLVYVCMSVCLVMISEVNAVCLFSGEGKPVCNTSSSSLSSVCLLQHHHARTQPIWSIFIIITKTNFIFHLIKLYFQYFRFIH